MLMPVHPTPSLPENTSDSRRKGESLSRLATLLSVAVASLLVLMKGGAWIYSGSVSLQASLMDSLLDVMASLVNFFALRFALQPPDKEHRFGHGKAEDVAALAQATFIAGSGLFLLVEAGRRLLRPEPVEHGALAMGVMVVSILLTGALVLFQRYAHRHSGSSVVKADSLHYVMDLLTNAAVILAVFLTVHLGWALADPIFALLIAAYILKSSGELGHGALQNLLDREFEPEERQKIKEKVLSHPQVRGLHKLKTRRGGTQLFIQFHLDLDGTLSLHAAHAVADTVEKWLLEMYPSADIIIHEDPV
jgi:ferrous-iron efflux pump FieF